MRITSTNVDLIVDDDRIVGQFTDLKPGYFILAVVEPIRGFARGCAYQSWLGAMSYHLGCGPRFVDPGGCPTDHLIRRLHEVLGRWLPLARFFERERDLLLAGRERIVARLARRATAQGWLDADSFEAQRATLAAQREAGLNGVVHDRLLKVLQERLLATRNVRELWPIRLAQHIDDRYHIWVKPQDLEDWLGPVDLGGQPPGGAEVLP